MFCAPETEGEAERNINNRGSTKHTAFLRSQSISILLLTECQKRKKVPQIIPTCILNQPF